MAVTDKDQEPNYQVTPFVTEGIQNPWSLAYLPNGNIILSELSGVLRIIAADGTVHPPLKGVPSVLFAGQGGLSDIIIDPKFQCNRRIYFSYAARDPSQNNAPTLFVASAVLTAKELLDVKTIFVAEAPRNAPVHYGAKLAFHPDGTLFITSGDGFDYREQAQSRESHFGKIIRINSDGSIPSNNPYAQSKNPIEQAIYSYGHRNQQGLVILDDGRVFSTEHGPRGGDEFNAIEPGKNYGWPAITYGKDYSFAYISPFTEMQGMEQPLYYWTPSIAPSGLLHYTGTAFPQWRNKFLVTALVNKSATLLASDAASVESDNLFAEIGARLRNIYQTPSGTILLITDGPKGQLLFIEPKQ